MRTIIVFLLTLFSVGISNAQHQWKHKPFKDFGQDTLSYLKQNFDSKFNGNYFKGKSVAELINHIVPKFERIEVACNKYNMLFRLDICYQKKTIVRSTNGNSKNSKFDHYFTVAVYVQKINCPTQLEDGLQWPIPKQTYNVLKNIVINDVRCYENEVLLIKKE